LNKCRSFIFSTALPPAVIAANIESLNIIKQDPKRREIVLDNAKYLRKLLNENKFEVLGETQIIPIMIGSEEKAVKISEALKEKHLLIYSENQEFCLVHLYFLIVSWYSLSCILCYILIPFLVHIYL